MAGRKPLGVSWGAHTSCQQRELSFLQPTASFSKASHMIHWVNMDEDNSPVKVDQWE